MGSGKRAGRRCELCGPASPVGGSGQASTVVVLGEEPGAILVTASAVGTGATVDFSLTSVVLPSSSVSMISGGNQIAHVGIELDPLTVRVRNVRGEPVSGQEIIFEIVDGQGSLSSAADTTDSQGGAATILHPASEPGQITGTDLQAQAVVTILSEDLGGAVVIGVLSGVLQEAVALLFTGGGTVPGAGGGQIVVEGTSFIFEDYSTDGELVINGQLDLEILASPVTLKGTIQLTGSIESEVVVDMTIDVTADPFVYSGIVAIDGETYSVDE